MRAVRRDDAELSATENRDQALSDADHLGVLHAIWMDQCRAAAYARYAQAVRDHADPVAAGEILKHTDRLWRTVRSAEMAGLDGGQVIRAALSGRSLTGARSHVAVLDSRIRGMTGHLPPRVRNSWAECLPVFADSELGRYMAEVAAAMDDRQRRLGEHAAREAPLWAVRALGQVPGQAEARAGWQAKPGSSAPTERCSAGTTPARPSAPSPARRSRRRVPNGTQSRFP